MMFDSNKICLLSCAQLEANKSMYSCIIVLGEHIWMSAAKSIFHSPVITELTYVSRELSIRKTGDTEHFRSVPHLFIDISAYRQISFKEMIHKHMMIFSYFPIPSNCFEYSAEVQSHFGVILSKRYSHYINPDNCSHMSRSKKFNHDLSN